MTLLRKQRNLLKYFVLSATLALSLLIYATVAVAGPVYYYVVTAVDVNGFESVFSNQATATFNQAQHIANMTWTPPTVPTGGSAIAGYNVYRGSVSGGPYIKINTALVTSVTYADTFTLPNAPSGLVATAQ